MKVFRDQFEQIERDLRFQFLDIKERMLKRFGNSDVKFDSQEEFIKWGSDYLDSLKAKVDTEKLDNAKTNFIVLIRNLGINDEILIQSFQQNKKELLDPLAGELIAILALVLGWKDHDKEQFSQALGEIGVAGLFAAKPFMLLIALCGLAYGYQRGFHGQAFKKGGVLGLSGMTAIALSPGGFVGILCAIVVMLYVNKKLKTDRPIETQLKEIFQQIRSGAFFGEVRQAWRDFEEFISNVFGGVKVSPDTSSV